MKEKLKQVTIKDLLNLICEYGGEIISSNELSPEMIDEARLTNRFFVDENSMGYVWRPVFKNNFPTTVHEVELFEKFYPTTPQLPNELSFDALLNKMNKSENREEQLKQAIEDKFPKYNDPLRDFNNVNPQRVIGAKLSLNDPNLLRHCDPEIMKQAGWIPEKEIEGYKLQLEELEVQLKEANKAGWVREEEWISVEDRLPERNKNVLLKRAKPFHVYLVTGFQRDGVFYSNESANNFDKVTHWKPLPNPPKQ